MNPDSLDRRHFHQLAAAAFGGLAAGAIAGCGSKEAVPETAASGPQHLCRGLNDCKEQGKNSANGCRGRGLCATVLHSCAGQNECKGLGGCGATAGANECKGKGGCAVPLMDSAWTKVRARMESEWKQKQATFGAAPAKEEKS